MTVGKLVVPAVDVPRVSVVLIMFGRSDLALQAVAALIDHTPPCYELIIVDNASPDESLAVIREHVTGAIIVANDLNVGFSAGVSVGALHARGEFLLLLNSDVFVESGWLPPLLEVLDADRRIAGVSPTLLNLDGTVQEAGSTLFASGETRALRGGERWACDFRRQVPYVSAACLMVRRSVYSRLGGFDTAYGRGYFEDVDFALELEAIGLSLALVPSSLARHVQGGSSTTESAWQQTFRNSRIFTERWKHRLMLLPHLITVDTVHGRADSQGSLLRGRDAMAADRALVIDDGERSADVAVTLARNVPAMRVTFLAADLQRAEELAASLLDAGVEVAACSLGDSTSWLEERFGHYSMVVSQSVAVGAHALAIARTQPQAMVLELRDDVSAEAVVELMADFGVAPPVSA